MGVSKGTNRNEVILYTILSCITIKMANITKLEVFSSITICDVVMECSCENHTCT